jgi:hypothetical protein
MYTCSIPLLCCRFHACNAFHRNYRKTISARFQQGEGKRNYFEIGQSSLLFITRPTLRRNYFYRA